MSRKYKKMSDEELVEEVISNNQEQYKQIVERYQHKLLRYVLTMLHGQDQAAQDVVQEVFIKAFVNLKSFNTKKKFSSWIYRIAHNETMNFIKKHKKEFLPDDDDWVSTLPDYRDSTDIVIERTYKQNVVKKAVSSLDRKYKEPLMLHAFEGYTYVEISEILKLPQGTVGIRISRAKNKLKEILTKELL